MDSTRIPIPAQTNNQTRYLPTYEESNAPYSLRLPSYRSAYIHRFHPYPRYAISLAKEQYMVSIFGLRSRWMDLDPSKDDCDHGDEPEPLLNLSILNGFVRTIPQATAEPVAAFADGPFVQQNEEGRVEEQPNERRDILSILI